MQTMSTISTMKPPEMKISVCTSNPKKPGVVVEVGVVLEVMDGVVLEVMDGVVIEVTVMSPTVIVNDMLRNSPMVSFIQIFNP